MRPMLAAVFCASVALAQVSQPQPPLHRTFTGRSIEVDNVFGSIHVTSSAGAAIELNADGRIVADDEERAAAAQREVKLDISETAGDIKVYVDGPFRCHCDERHSFRSRNDTREHGRRGYKAVYNFDIKAPEGTALYLSTVNEGTIVVDGGAGDFDIQNINGGVHMNNISGSGRVYALNGGVAVTFARNPQRSSYFGSLNGLVDVAFQPDLSADVRVKTFNGGVYTDFAVSNLPAAAVQAKREGGKFIYRSNDFQGFRIGQGGPEYKFENFNGNIQIRNRGRQ